MAKYTVFFEQINRTNIQVIARNEQGALEKAFKIYKRTCGGMPSTDIQDGWLVEDDGEDK